MTKQLADFINYSKHLGVDSCVQKWIDNTAVKYIKRYKPKIEEVEHIIDFLVSDKAPERIAKMPYTQARKLAEKWTKALQKKGEHIQETDKDTEVVLDFKDGFKIVRLIGQNAYKREGFLMRHCVADYYGRGVEVYSLRDAKNQPHCTIVSSFETGLTTISLINRNAHKKEEFFMGHRFFDDYDKDIESYPLRDSKNKPQYTVEKDQQIKGKWSGDIHPRYIKYVVESLEHTGMIAISKHEMLHLGYRTAKFPKYCENKIFRGRYIYKHEKEKYDKKKVIIFRDIEKAVKYKGKKICLFDGDVNFKDFKIKSLGKIKAISGDAYFEDSKVEDLGVLESIEGDARFRDSSVKSLGELRLIGGYADFRDSKIKSLGNLEYIGASLTIQNNKKIKTLGNIKVIGSTLCINNTNITSLGNLKKIGDMLIIEDSGITSLNKLERVRNFDLKKTKVTSLGNLKKAYCLDIDFNYNKLKSLGKLRDIKDNLTIKNYTGKSLQLNNINYINKLCLMDSKLDYISENRKIKIGDLEITRSYIKSLKNIKLSLSQDKNNNNLRSKITVVNSKIGTFSNMVSENNDVIIGCSAIKSFGSGLKCVHNLVIDNSTIKSLGRLKEAKNAYLREASRNSVNIKESKNKIIITNNINNNFVYICRELDKRKIRYKGGDIFRYFKNIAENITTITNNDKMFPPAVRFFNFLHGKI